MEEEPKGWMWTSQPLPGSSPLPVSSSFIFEEGREEVRSDRWESGSDTVLLTVFSLLRKTVRTVSISSLFLSLTGINLQHKVMYCAVVNDRGNRNRKEMEETVRRYQRPNINKRLAAEYLPPVSSSLLLI